MLTRTWPASKSLHVNLRNMEAEYDISAGVECLVKIYYTWQQSQKQ